MTKIWVGNTNLRAAQESGCLELKGDPTLIRTIASWLLPGLFAHIRPQNAAQMRREENRCASENATTASCRRVTSPEAEGRSEFASL
jgi:hypothetical protein